jgi:geranylgeranylglycerol-phosphate geranylgeranyltransferase
MLKVKSYIELTRPANGLIAAVSILVGAVIGGAIEPIRSAILACCSGICIAAGGNAINDYFDVAIDRINRPQRPLPSGRVSPTGVLLFSLLLLVTGTLIGVALGWKTGSVAFTCSILLVLYSFRFKRIALLGNGTVSLVAALAFVYGGLIYDRLGPTLIPAWYAFLFHLGREIIKDIQDYEGDTATHAQTLPIRCGTQTAMVVTSYTFILLILSTMVPALFRIYGIAYLIVVVLGVDIPLMYIIRSMWRDPQPANLGRISFILKIDMLIGLLAIYLGAR